MCPSHIKCHHVLTWRSVWVRLLFLHWSMLSTDTCWFSRFRLPFPGTLNFPPELWLCKICFITLSKSFLYLTIRVCAKIAGTMLRHYQDTSIQLLGRFLDVFCSLDMLLVSQASTTNYLTNNCTSELENRLGQ